MAGQNCIVKMEGSKWYRRNSKNLYYQAGILHQKKYANPEKPIEWIKIHNLPDHVYFNHSQHVKAGKVQCQTCHGPITEMGEVKQFADLSMGWCINCHRETKVIFTILKSAR